MVDVLHSLVDRMSGRISYGNGGKSRVAPAPGAKEPCAFCGEETAVGTVRFSDRLRITRADKPIVFVCGECDSEIRAAHKPEQWQSEDVDSFTRNASAAAITWWQGV
jgi:hypothetical protein